jgi:charged multivesicular body protein 2A
VPALFGRKVSPEEQIKEHKRTIDRAIRELDRERSRLEMQERKLVADIKKMAAQNQMGAVKIMAKDLVRTRHYVQRFMKMRAQMQAVGLRIQTVKSTQAMTSCMAGAAHAMTRMNQQLNIPALQKTLMEFERSSELMDAKEEMVSDAVDDIFAEADDEQQEEEVVSQVLASIGINFQETLHEAPTGGLALPEVPTQQAEAMDDGTADLESRIGKL